MTAASSSRRRGFRSSRSCTGTVGSDPTNSEGCAVSSRGPLVIPDPVALLDLVDWRRRVGDLYRTSGPNAVETFRKGRDELFRSHPQSPIEPEERNAFMGLKYFPYDPAYRVSAQMLAADSSELLIDTGGQDGAIRYRRAGELHFRLAGEPCKLTGLSLILCAGGQLRTFNAHTGPRDS